MKKLFIFVIVLALIAAGAAVFLASNSDKATSVKADDIKVKSDPKEDAGLRPEPGKYTYIGSGKETVSILGGGEHVFPKKFTTTVELGEGCEWVFKLYYLKEHREREVWCTDKDKITEVSYTQELKFFGSTEKVNFACTGAILPTNAQPGDKVTHTCTDKGRKEVRAVVVGQPEQLTIGGKTIDVIPVKSRTKLTGVTVGTSTSDWWFLENGLLAKYVTETDVRSDSILGETDYKLSSSYVLQDVEPA